MKRYDGQVAVVTGASSGLGRRLALDLAAKGADVVGIARRPSPDGVRSLQCDVADESAYRDALGGLGSIDVLIHAAGMEQRTRIEEADLDLYHRTMAVNFFSAVAGTLAVVPGMVERGRGIVVNISSDHGRAPAPGTPAYSASKAALSAFTESVAHEVRNRGVRLHVLYPGWVPTPLGQGAVDQGMPKPPKAVRRSEEQISAFVLERMGGPVVDLNAAKVAVMAPVVRSLAPRLYNRMMAKQG